MTTIKPDFILRGGDVLNDTDLRPLIRYRVIRFPGDPVDIELLTTELIVRHEVDEAKGWTWPTIEMRMTCLFESDEFDVECVCRGVEIEHEHGRVTAYIVSYEVREV